MKNYMTDFHHEQGFIGYRPSSYKKLICSAWLMHSFKINQVFDVGAGEGRAIRVFRTLGLDARGVEIYAKVVPQRLKERGIISLGNALDVPLVEFYPALEHVRSAVWMYHPFSGEKFRIFLNRNAALFETSEIVLFYNNPVEQKMLPPGTEDRMIGNMLMRFYGFKP